MLARERYAPWELIRSIEPVQGMSSRVDGTSCWAYINYHLGSNIKACAACVLRRHDSKVPGYGVSVLLGLPDSRKNRWWQSRLSVVASPLGAKAAGVHCTWKTGAAAVCNAKYLLYSTLFDTTLHDMLHAIPIYYVHTIYCIIYTIYYILQTTYYVLSTAYHLRYTVYTVYSLY